MCITHNNRFQCIKSKTNNIYKIVKLKEKGIRNTYNKIANNLVIMTDLENVNPQSISNWLKKNIK